MNNIILGAGIAGIAASYELKKNNIDSVIFEKNSNWGGLLDNFSVDGFRFDKFVHFSFSKEEYVNNIFSKTPFFQHQPLSYNYYKGFWLKHPAQNNLYPLPKAEQNIILEDFKNRKEIPSEAVLNYEQWLKIQFGDYFAENFPMVYTKKYWTIDARELETKWIGERLYRPTLEEVEKGCSTDITPNTYYASTMRYPENGGYKSFIEPMIDGLTIKQNSEIVAIDLRTKIVKFKNGETHQFDNLISSLPLPEICKYIRNIPNNVLEASNKLNFTSGYLISLGFNKPDVANKLWFYIYDKDILPARIYSPSLKSPNNVPKGCSSIQAELYFNKGQKLNIGDDELLEQTIQTLIRIGLFNEEDLLVKDIRAEKYANVIFDHHIYENKKIILDYLSENNIISVGRFGEWDYFWSDQSLISGRDGARKIMKKIING